MNKFTCRFLFVALLLTATSIFQAGCAMCCGTYDEAYAGHGGKFQRSDLFNGRVGSPFSDPNATYYDGHPIETIESIDDSQLEVIE